MCRAKSDVERSSRFGYQFRPHPKASSTARSIMRENWTFNSAGQLVFGRNAVREPADIWTRLRAGRVFVVADSMLSGAGLVERVRAPLLEGGAVVEVFTGGEPEPSLRTAGECIDAARGFRPDAVLGLGG